MIEGKFLDFIFQHWGAWGVVGIVLIFALIRFIPIDFAAQYKTWLKSNTTYYQPRDVLLTKLDYWTNFKIDHLQLADPGRQKIFREILLLKFQSFRSYVMHMDDNYNNKMSPQELYNVFVTTFNQTVDEYEKAAIDRGIPEIVMVKFGQWQLKTYEFTLTNAETICYSAVYGDNETRIQAIFNLFMSMMELTIAEAERTLVTLNGELTGIEYKGVVCG